MTSSSRIQQRLEVVSVFLIFDLCLIFVLFFIFCQIFWNRNYFSRENTTGFAFNGNQIFDRKRKSAEMISRGIKFKHNINRAKDVWTNAVTDERLIGGNVFLIIN